MLVSVHKLNFFLLFWLGGITAANAQVFSLQQCIDTALKAEGKHFKEALILAVKGRMRPILMTT